MGFNRMIIKWKMLIQKVLFKKTCITFIIITTLVVVFRIYFDQALEYSPNAGNGHISRLYNLIYNKNSLALKEFTGRSCKLSSLRHSPAPASIPDGENLCQLYDPMPGSCDVANRLFLSHPQSSCSHQKKYEFCKLENVHDKWSVTCDEKLSSSCASNFYLGFFNQSSGSLNWQEAGMAQQIAGKLTGYLRNWNKPNTPQFYGFCFIRCELKSKIGFFQSPRFDDDITSDLFGEQMLVLPPQFSPIGQTGSGSQNPINVNIVFVDSVSHQHFFRSLKETVEALKRINGDSHLLGRILDFRLFQAVRSRTFESLQVLFSGQIHPLATPFGTQDLPNERLHLEVLLKKYKEKGYKTLWLEDLCYLWEWGLAKDLLFMNKSSSSKDTWERMWSTLKECAVDSVDVTLSMCRILKANGVMDHFHGPEAVCFNGRHQHEYILEHLLLYQQQMVKQHQPFFTFTMINVGHEDTGRRIQTLDSALATYITESVNLNHTLTVILSDHGNSYGAFFKESQEANMELFHPFMFFVIPKGVEALLGTDSLHSLVANTDRLVSLLDLHYTLNSLVDSSPAVPEEHKGYLVSPRGLFHMVSANRTCNNIPRIMPSLCICRNFDTPMDGDSSYSLFAYFAVGQLNNELQRQVSRRLLNGDSRKKQPAFRNCQRLVLLNVQNIKKNLAEQGTEIVKMDLLVQEGEIFFVAVRITYFEDQTSHAVLEKYDRTTPYSEFSACADIGVDLSLCICSLPGQDSETLQSEHGGPDFTEFSDMDLLPGFEAQTQRLNCAHNCVELVTVKNVQGAVAFVVNSCPGNGFRLEMKLEAEEEIAYSWPPSKPLVISPLGVVNVGLLYSATEKDWMLSIRLQCTVL